MYEHHFRILFASISRIVQYTKEKSTDHLHFHFNRNLHPADFPIGPFIARADQLLAMYATASIDEKCKRHQLAIDSMRKMEDELAQYKRDIASCRDAGDSDGIHRLRNKMDILVSSMNVIRRDLDKTECELANAFVDGKPWHDTTSSDSYMY